MLLESLEYNFAHTRTSDEVHVIALPLLETHLIFSLGFALADDDLQQEAEFLELLVSSIVILLESLVSRVSGVCERIRGAGLRICVDGMRRRGRAWLALGKQLRVCRVSFASGLRRHADLPTSSDMKVIERERERGWKAARGNIGFREVQVCAHRYSAVG